MSKNTSLSLQCTLQDRALKKWKFKTALQNLYHYKYVFIIHYSTS